MWLRILISFNMVSQLQGFTPGGFTESCSSMLPQHGESGPQNTTPPYRITLQKGNSTNDPVKVTLERNDTSIFIGFMLQARNTTDGPAIGKFTLLDDSDTMFLTCDGSPFSTVTQNHNREKTSISVTWSPQGAEGNITFRATVLQKYLIFWNNVEYFYDRTIKTPNKSDPQDPQDPQDRYETFGLTAMCMESLVEVVTWTMAQCFTTSNSKLNKGLMISSNAACFVLATVSLAFFLVAKPSSVTLVVLVVAGIVIIIIKLVLVSLPLGPSHELKGICNLSHRCCCTIHRVFTLAVILVGVVNCICLCGENQALYWPLIVLIAYTVWIRLNEIWISELNVQKRRLQTNKKERSGHEQWEPQGIKECLCAVKMNIVGAVVFTFGNLLLNAALISGLFFCKKPTV